MAMIEHPISRRQNTAPKRVWLTHGTREAVQMWADAQGVSFSSALDTLARIGLGQAPSLAVAPMVVSAVRTEVQRQTHRLAALIAAAALESGVTARLAGATLREVMAQARGAIYTYRIVLSTRDAPLKNADYREALGGRFDRWYITQHHEGEHPHAHVIAFTNQRLNTTDLRGMREELLVRERDREREWERERAHKRGADLRW
ncbi:MAG: hypothetical protein NVS4B2_35840 [Chloroflexota bacterium]